MIYGGCDISLDHGALVLLGESFMEYHYFTATKKWAKPPQGTHLEKTKSDDKQQVAVDRLKFIDDWLASKLDADYLGIEDYAYGMGQQAHQLGEVGCISRLLAKMYGIKFRLHDPASVKLFATGNGKAEKPEMIEAASAWWPAIKALKALEVEERTREDLADAFHIARMVRTEHELRTGKILLSSLPEHQIRVFNRTTKAQPINVLARDWLH